MPFDMQAHDMLSTIYDADNRLGEKMRALLTRGRWLDACDSLFGRERDSTRYCCGFLFNEAMDRVVLIEKARPDWQRGRLNGVGGKLEPGESYSNAMEREFREETGIDIMSWDRVLRMDGPGYRIEFFRGMASDEDLDRCRTTTDETVFVLGYDAALMDPRLIPNLRWILPLCRDEGYETLIGRFR